MWTRLPGIVLCMLLLLGGGRRVHADDGPAGGEEFFENRIRPLLAEHCQACHGTDKAEGGLRLTSREEVLRGGDSGPAVVPGAADDSLLVQAVGYLDEPKMPPQGKLSAAEIGDLTRWVAIGAPWPASDVPPDAGRAAAKGAFAITPRQRSWWAFQPIDDPPVPAVADARWPRDDIDRFVLAELESRGMSPAPPADRRVWLRRVTFDLTGLPPTPAELDAFLADASAGAFAAVVDRLLASPAYGQRFARHWLDVARYADFHDANPAARVASCDPLEAWRYRDWVVDAFNADMPFDRFITLQICGDVLPSPDGQEPHAAGLVATAFLANGVWDRGDADKEKLLSDMVDDQIDTVGKAFLGLTLGCARCHDHKFDPVSTEDYYALAGIFYSTRFLDSLGTKGGEITLERVPLVPRSVAAERDARLLKIDAVMAALAALDKATPAVAADHPERLALVAERDALEAELPPPYPVALAVQEGGTPGSPFPNVQDVPIHIRGSHTRLGPVVPRRMPAFWAGDVQPPIAHGSGRRELAEWIASHTNPLTPRVIVNRIWLWHFGAGLVRTPNNLGLLSEPPSHPALVDWLASRFVADGWSLKNLHRRIVLSATYRQDSRVSPEAHERDPENRWLGRFAGRRLDAEAIRDAMLAVSGQLDCTGGGPAGDDFSIRRRSLYVQTARWQRDSYAILFDAANPDASIDCRTSSTVAPQALLLLNHPFVHEQAAHLAKRLTETGTDDDSERIRWAYRLLFGRPPSAEELAVGLAIATAGNPATGAGWTDFAHVLLCTNEFVFVD